MIDRETIIRMAEEAGGRAMQPYDYGDTPDRMIMMYGSLVKFAQLVAEHEREACAKLAIEVMDKQGTWGHRQLACEEVASRIRLRK